MHTEHQSTILSPFLERVSDPAGHVIVPGLIGSELRVTAARVAALAGVHRNTLSKSPNSPEVQEGLGAVVRIIARAEGLLGDHGKAVIWFLHQPLAGFDGQTAEELVAAGHADAVMAHLDMVEEGVYA